MSQKRLTEGLRQQGGGVKRARLSLERKGGDWRDCCLLAATTLLLKVQTDLQQ